MKPIYSTVDKMMHEAEDAIVKELASVSGLGVSYTSLSPSFLSGINVNNLTIFDSQTQEKLCSIKKVTFRYNIIKLIKQDFSNAFAKLIISDVTINIDKDKVKIIVNKILSATQKLKTSNNQEKHAKEPVANTKSSKKNIISYLPKEIQIKRLTANYIDSKKQATAKIDKVLLLKQEANSFSFTANKAFAFVKFISSGKTAGVNISFGGKLLSKIDGSSLILSLDQYEKADFSVRKTQFLLRYINDCIVARSTQRVLPYTLSAEYNIKTKDYFVEAQTDLLDVLSAVKVPLTNKILAKIKALKLTVTGNIKGNLQQKQFNWQGIGNFEIPSDIIDGGQQVSFDAFGSRNIITVNSIVANGKLFAFDACGSYDIANKKPVADINLKHFLLKNGNKLAFNASVLSQNNKVKAYIAKLKLGEQVFSDVTINADILKKNIPFTVELLDLSKKDKTAKINIDGTFAYGSKKSLKAKLLVNDLFCDSIAKAIVFFANSKAQKTIIPRIPLAKEFVTNDEISFYTDFKEFTYNAPKISFINTKKENQSIFASFAGDNKSLKVNDLEVSLKNIVAKVVASFDISPEDKQIIFNTDCTINDIPYQLNGAYTQKKWINITGNYGLDVLVNLEKGFKGNACFDLLPIAIKDYQYAVSLETSFDFKNLEDYSFLIDNLQVEEVKGRLGVASKFSAMGKIDSMGFIIDTLAYSDKNSAIDGTGYILWNINNGIFDSLNVSINASNDFTGEKFFVEAGMSNPLHVALTKENVKKDFYFSAQADIKSFPLNRVIKKQYADDTFSGVLSASGTIDNPYISLDVQNFSAQVGTRPFIASGKAELLEGDATVPFINISWGNFKVQDVNARLDLNTFNGEVSALFKAKIFAGRVVEAPLTLKVINESKKELDSQKPKLLSVPKEFVVTVDSDVAINRLFNETVPVHAKITRKDGIVDIATDDYLGVTGNYTIETGAIYLSAKKSKPFYGYASGTVKKQRVNLAIGGLNVDLSKFADLINTDYYGVHKGILSGQLAVTGLTSDPILNGSIRIRSFDMSLPSLIPSHILSKNLALTLQQNKIELPKTNFSVDGSTVTVKANVELDRWSVASLTSVVETLDDNGIPINSNIPKFKVNGFACFNADMSYSSGQMTVNGNVSVHNSEFSLQNSLSEVDLTSVLTGVQNEKPSGGGALAAFLESTDLVLNLNVNVGRKVTLVINPFLRALVAPDTPIKVSMDSGKSVWSIKGDVVLRGGQIIYLSRNFYLKEGRVVLNETQNRFDPYITARAETRERDDDGVSVTIVLSAEHQPISSFSPNIYSIPARSENQIFAMLGQIVSGDSENAGNLLVAGFDYGMQMTFLRKIENSLRDLCNFDIFSIRINVLQNALKYGINSSSTVNHNVTDETLRNPIGNYLDNSSVYIGKYFGSSIYADMLLQWTYDSSIKEDSMLTVNGLVFHPEIGLELASPVANIRFDFAPDLRPLRDGEIPNLVSAASITLSWRITF